VCAFAGLRIGEAAGLQLDDVDFLRRTIAVRRQIKGETWTTTRVVPPKAGSERVVYVPEDLMTMLAQHVEHLGTLGAEQWLMRSPDGHVYRRSSAGPQWRNVRREVAMEGFALHSLRHFFASGRIADGCDVVTAQRAMGHSSPTITLNTYSHLWPTAEDRTRSAAAGLMQAALGAPADPVRTGVGS
jgi:integrase